MSAPLGPNYRRLFGAHVVSNLGDGVGLVAYPWLASAVTRNPLLVALVAVAQRLPWLVFTLPAGVITDRSDRRRLMVTCDIVRGALTLFVGLAVLGRGGLPGPDALDTVTGTEPVLYPIVLLATLLIGFAEVLRDNSAQTLMPAIVSSDQLETANGRLWSAEGVANTFVGPPLGSLLLTVAFALPLFVDAATFFASAALVMAMTGTFAAGRAADAAARSWVVEMKEGFGWLWRHQLLRPMAIMLGIQNGASALCLATLVLFAQEVLRTSSATFAVLLMGGAVGGVVAGAFSAGLSRRLGGGPCLAISLAGMGISSGAVGLFSSWPPVFVMMGLTALFGTLWNVITVSLRQAIIPPHLLGRVNSVYRFFAWGMMPIGSALGGVLVVVLDGPVSREMALRIPWFVQGTIYAVLFAAGLRLLTTDRIAEARAAAESPTGVSLGRNDR